MTRSRSLACAFILLLLMSCLAACQSDAVSSPTQPSSTASPQPTKTITPTSTITSTPEPTFTETPTPTATSRWDDLVLQLTPLPEVDEVISTENADQVVETAVWGTGRPNDIALSADGLTLGVGTNIGVYLYDSLTYQLLNALQTSHAVVSVAFSPDNQWLALGQNDGGIDIYDLAEMSLAARLTPQLAGVSDITEVTVVFSEDGSYLTCIVETAEEVSLNRWDTSDWEADESFSLDNGLTTYINNAVNVVGIFSEDVLTLQSLSFQEESTMVVLPEITQELFWQYLSTYEVNIAPSADGDFILVSTGATVIHWEVTAEEVTYLLDDYPQTLSDPCYDVPDTCLNADGGYSWTCSDALVSPIEMIAITPDDVMVLISLNEGRSEFRSASDGMLVWEIDAYFTDITYSPGSEYFFGLREDGTIEKRSTLDGELMDSLNSHPTQLFDLAFSPDGTILAVGFNDEWVRVYDLVDGTMLGVLTGSARSLSFSPDSSLLAAGLDDGTVRIFELVEGTYYDLSPGHLAAVTDVTFTADGQQLVTGSDDCTVSIWDLADGESVVNISPDEEDPFRISEVEISDGNLLQFIAGNRGSVYRVEDSIAQQISLSAMDVVEDLKLSAGDAYLAVSGLPSYLLPNPESVLATTSLEVDPAQETAVYTAAFTSDGAVLIQATSQDLTLWSVEDSTLISSLSFYESEVPGGTPADLEVSPDGTLIALGTQDGLIHIFGIAAALAD